MVEGIGRNIKESLIWVLGLSITAGILFGVFVMYGIPKLWHILKPVIHSITG